MRKIVGKNLKLICPKCNGYKCYPSKVCTKCYLENRPPRIGYKHSKETLEKLKIAWSIKKINGMMLGKNHPLWTENPSYRSLHIWVENHKGKSNICEECRGTFKGHKIHWANKSGDYKRELSDWIRLCAKCHAIFDKKNKLRKIYA